MHLYGSLMEVMSQLDIALDLNFIDNENYKRLEEMIEEEARYFRVIVLRFLTESLSSKLKTLS